MVQYTPMIQQYLEIKAQYDDAFLFFRLGDFYEMFFDDAIKAAQELEIALTKRDGGGDKPVPMCGVPYHSAEYYISKLIKKGYKIAICEQTEDPKKAKGVVKREVVQVITPGTVMNDAMIDEKRNNFIAAVTPFQDGTYGFAVSDLSTGENRVTLIKENWETVCQEVLSTGAKELIIPSSMNDEEITKVTDGHQLTVSVEDETEISDAFDGIVHALTDEKMRIAFGRLLNYLLRTQKRALDHLQPVDIYQLNAFMKIDMYSKRNLELVETIRGEGRKGSLIWLLDKTVTAMGGRLLKQWIERPLIEQSEIEKRHDMVESLLTHFFQREEIREQLKEVYDLERLAGKVSYGNVSPRDLFQLKQSLKQVPKLVEIVDQLDNPYFQQLIKGLPSFSSLTEKLDRALNDHPPTSAKEGGIIRNGYSEELDKYREAKVNGNTWLRDLEQREKKATGIKSLKIGYNKVFGYYIEVTKANLHLLPEGRYERKQTLANAERYITPDLKEMEAKILHAEEKMIELEYELFVSLKEEVKTYISSIQLLAKIISQIDVLQSYAVVSEEQRYVRPSFKQTVIDIKEGRHPVVEKVLTDGQYVTNDVRMDNEREILLITGPNMSGKSTYMRQLALTAIMAQIGCFVPAEEAVLPVFDQVFTRIGAADDLVGGQSTFMVEMLETKYALTNATRNSLILLDEIGRGTSTYDGMALAQAIIEYIHDEIGAKTLFSTHYHELTALENELPRLKNVHVQAIEEEGRVVFLHKVHEGAADRSYGIHVAQLADLPAQLIERAQAILKQFEEQGIKTRDDQVEEKEPDFDAETMQLSFFHTENVPDKRQEQNLIKEIANLDILDMTPLDAINTLYRLQKKVKSRTKKG